MNSISLAQTDYTPQVELNLDSKTLFIAGFSMPENTKAFYDPIVSGLTEYFESGEKKLDVSLRFEYFNTSSSKAIYDILSLIEDHDSSEVVVTWTCDNDDDEMINAGNQFKSMFEIKNFKLEILNS
ncbi:MAG: DUF1987 domain-containing protein [Flavobacteriales bacterium]|nr:DUF1987 domain-containing protein [Flavobacteriales bacterium]